MWFILENSAMEVLGDIKMQVAFSKKNDTLKDQISSLWYVSNQYLTTTQNYFIATGEDFLNSISSNKSKYISKFFILIGKAIAVI